MLRAGGELRAAPCFLGLCFLGSLIGHTGRGAGPASITLLQKARREQGLAREQKRERVIILFASVPPAPASHPSRWSPSGR